MAQYNKLLDENRLAQLWALIKGKFVQAETGKGLSTNDFTTDEKNKLSNIEAGANENIIEGIAVNNVDIAPVNKRVNLTVPTKVSDLTNDEKFQTDTEVASAIKNSGYQANVIETVKVNGSILDVDSKKSVNVIVPTDNSVLANGAGYQTASDVSSALTNSGYQANVIETVKVNNVALTPSSKAVNITVPTKVSDLTNDKKFQTDTQVASAIKGSGYQANVIETVKVNNVALTPSSKAVNITVPTKVSDLTNDKKFQTDTQVASAIKGSGYQANVIETVKVNNVALVPSSKTVNITVPTDNSALTNGAGYQTAKNVTDAINEAIGGLTGISFEIVETLPTQGKTGVIYLIAHSHGTKDNYDEYIWLEKSKSYEKIGNTDVDLSNYVTKNDITIMTEQELAAICV